MWRSGTISFNPPRTLFYKCSIIYIFWSYCVILPETRKNALLELAIATHEQIIYMQTDDTAGKVSFRVVSCERMKQLVQNIIVGKVLAAHRGSAVY